MPNSYYAPIYSCKEIFIFIFHSQVEEVLHQAEKSKDEFDEKYKRTESSVETYMVETVQTMSVLEDLFTVGQQTVLKSHDVEILESYDDLIGELKDKVGDRSEEINFSLEPVYLNKGNCLDSTKYLIIVFEHLLMIGPYKFEIGQYLSGEPITNARTDETFLNMKLIQSHFHYIWHWLSFPVNQIRANTLDWGG